jgi:DNA-binding transcriptional regulator YiaG
MHADYTYHESGLDNIVLENISMYVCSCGNKFPILSNMRHLHALIAENIIKKPERLSGKEARFLRKEMGMKAIDFAKLLNVSKVTISRWENENKPISIISDKLIRSIFILQKEGVQSKRFSDFLKCIGSVSQGKKKRLSRMSIPGKSISNYKGFGSGKAVSLER